MSDTTWLAIIGLVTMVVKDYLDRRRIRDQENRLKDVAAKIEEVHKATNSLTYRLVETTKTEAHAAGMKEEKDKADGRTL